MADHVADLVGQLQEATFNALGERTRYNVSVVASPEECVRAYRDFRGRDVAILPAAELEALRAERDALYSACEAIVTLRAMHNHESYRPGWLESLMPQIRAAVAKAEGREG